MNWISFYVWSMISIRCPSIIFLWKYTYVQSVYNASKTTDATFIPLEHLSLHLVCCEIRVVTLSLVFCKVFRGSLCVYYFIFHLFIVMSVNIQLTTFDCHFGIFKLFALVFGFLWEENKIDMMASVLYLHGFFEIKWKNIVIFYHSLWLYYGH